MIEWLMKRRNIESVIKTNWKITSIPWSNRASSTWKLRNWHRGSKVRSGKSKQVQLERLKVAHFDRKATVQLDPWTKRIVLWGPKTKTWPTLRSKIETARSGYFRTKTCPKAIWPHWSRTLRSLIGPRFCHRGKPALYAVPTRLGRVLRVQCL